MRKLLLLLVLKCSVCSVMMAQAITSTYSPAYGCPNTTHDVTVTITNGATAVPSTAAATVNLTVKADDGTTVLKTATLSLASGLAANASQDFVITAIPFVGAMTCTIEGTINGTILIPSPTPPYIPLPFPFSYPVPTQNYVVQYPPDLTITSTGNDLSTTTSLDGYSVQYFLDGNYSNVIDQSTTGNYTAAASGSYTAKAYDPVSTCLSANASNAIVANLTAVQKANGVNVSMYPNPVSSVLTIETGLSYLLTYELTDLSGAIVRSGTFEGTGTVNLETMKSGVYMLNIKNDKEQLGSYKLVK
ncbi:MAG TPA: T9SS type A sorting domain-containing protein [Cytophagaceae bacterium]|jgi:hypothetical protein|nr:T9SS type A sorting domain-containing protein [Cytophagaceae bacterium]